jgi:hypothetical protein
VRALLRAHSRLAVVCLPDDLARLDAVLNEERLLQEIASGNQRLLDFLKLPTVLGQLIAYATLGTAPSPKLCNVAHEVLSCDCTAIMHFLVHSDDLLARVFAILDQPSPLGARQAGYFNSLLTLLVHRDAGRVLRMASSRTAAPWVAAATIGKQVDSLKRTGGPEVAFEPQAKVAANPHGFLPKFLKHMDTYSVASAMTVLVHEGAAPRLPARPPPQPTHRSQLPSQPARSTTWTRLAGTCGPEVWAPASWCCPR